MGKCEMVNRLSQWSMFFELRDKRLRWICPAPTTLCTPILAHGSQGGAQDGTPWVPWVKTLTSATSELEILAFLNHISQTPDLAIQVKDKSATLYVIFTPKIFHLLPHSHTVYQSTAVMNTPFGIGLTWIRISDMPLTSSVTLDKLPLDFLIPVVGILIPIHQSYFEN